MWTFGIPTVSSGPQFIVPDHLIQPAYRTLLAAGFPPCQEGGNCLQLRGNRSSPRPEEHFHLYPELVDDVHTDILGLYKKSNLLWTLPDLELKLPAADDPNFMLASDERLPKTPDGGSGPWPSFLHPVRILTPTRFLETQILLHCRDYLHANCYSAHWNANLTYIAEYVKPHNLIKEEDLDPRFLPFWRTMVDLNNLPPQSFKEELSKVRQKLIEDNELPPPAPVYNVEPDVAQKLGPYVT
ncbi:hypothetical protein PHISCL_01433 [Aspergillus sclerotialis]|uniref:Uncharacterized protein n=1 Tax=Aspergillus sclerotialis TaxID=2070753 RepID=A0A3A3A897_9EURO|nr:hypothetical protein PHISCL_01433 [Aspergillus sclerotialis]